MKWVRLKDKIPSEKKYCLVALLYIAKGKAIAADYALGRGFKNEHDEGINTSELGTFYRSAPNVYWCYIVDPKHGGTK
jgi:hypothetical protein